MPIEDLLDETLADLERKDVEIRSSMSIIRFGTKVNATVDVTREFRASCDLKQIIGVTKMLH